MCDICIISVFSVMLMSVTVPIKGRLASICFTADLFYALGFFQYSVEIDEQESIILKTTVFTLLSYIITRILIGLNLGIPDQIYYTIAYAPFAIVLYYTSYKFLWHKESTEWDKAMDGA